MARVTARAIADKGVWEAFLAIRAEANFLQSWNWGEFHQALDKTVYRQGFYGGPDGEMLVGVMQSVVEPARRGRYLTVPGGPIIDWADEAVVDAVVTEMRRQARASQCGFVRVRPQLVASDHSHRLFADLGFRSAPMHLHAELTHQLELTHSLDEIMAGMRKQTRYAIRQSQKQDIRVDMTNDPDTITTFYELQLETAKRQGFVPFSLAYLQEQFRVFAADGQALLYSAYHGDTLLVQAFIIFYGREAAYHYGTSTVAGRQYPGAYAIQWAAITEAKRRGLARYNFWGVSPPGAAEHRFAGVSTFKRGFGGTDMEYLHAHDLVINPIAYALSQAVESIRARSRRV